MKKFLFSLALVIAGTTAFSQINKGQWLVGGDVNFSTNKRADADDKTRETSFNVSPNAGYFFMDQFAGGLRVSFATSKVKGDKDGITSIAGAPFVRYYFLPAAQKVNVFADASYGFGSVNSDKSVGFNVYSIMAGPAVFLTPNTALEFTVGYTSTGGEAYKDLKGDVKRENTLGMNVGFQIHLGSAKAAKK